MDVVKAVFTVSEVDLSNVGVGTTVSISAGQLHLSGAVDFISPIVNTDDRTVRVKAEIPNPTLSTQAGDVCGSQHRPFSVRGLAAAPP